MGTTGRFEVQNFVNEDFFRLMSHDLAWVLGLLSADGHVEPNGRRVSLSQSGPQGQEIVEAVAQLIGFTGTLRHRKTKKQSATVLKFTSQSACEQLARYGVVNGKTKSLVFPNLPEEYYSSYIRGYIDGDGSVGTYKVGASNNFYVISVVGTAELMNDFSNIVPAKNCILTRKAGVTEARWNGQNGFLASRWIYKDDSLPQTKKSRLWKAYEKGLADEPPRWYRHYI